MKKLTVVVFLALFTFLPAYGFNYTPLGYPPPVSPVNISGTITTGGTAQTISAANDNRRGFWVMNLSTGSLWLNEMSTATQASPSIEIKPGQLYESPYGGTSKNALSLIGATTGQAFAAREW